MRRGTRIREGLLKVLEEIDHLVPAPQHPRFGPGRPQPILQLIGKRGIGGFDVARVASSIPLLENLPERAKGIRLSGWHVLRSISLGPPCLGKISEPAATPTARRPAADVTHLATYSAAVIPAAWAPR